MPDKVAFAGFARVGKDVAAQALLERGYERACFGDVIKRWSRNVTAEQFIRTVAWVKDNETDTAGVEADLYSGWGLLCRRRIDPFTEVTEEKARIRTWLERFGEACYSEMLAEFLATLPVRAVNTRLVRCREAEAWRAMGGVILCVVRPGTDAASEWERDRLADLAGGGFIDDVIDNDGTVAELHQKVREALHG